MENRFREEEVSFMGAEQEVGKVLCIYKKKVLDDLLGCGFCCPWS